MNDRETLIEMFNRNKIDFKWEGEEIHIEAGYIGFVSCFKFKEDGSLASVKAYE